MPGSGPWRRVRGVVWSTGLNLEACGWLPCHLPLGFLPWTWGLGSFGGGGVWPWAGVMVPPSPVRSSWEFRKLGPG